MEQEGTLVRFNDIIPSGVAPLLQWEGCRGGNTRNRPTH